VVVLMGTAEGQLWNVLAESAPAASDEEIAPLAQANAAAPKSAATFTRFISISP
jgi:hypothetical protein